MGVLQGAPSRTERCRSQQPSSPWFVAPAFLPLGIGREVNSDVHRCLRFCPSIPFMWFLAH